MKHGGSMPSIKPTTTTKQETKTNHTDDIASAFGAGIAPAK